jgi:hypothetical protein
VAKRPEGAVFFLELPKRTPTFRDVASGETVSSPAFDRPYVEGRDPTGALLATPATLSSLTEAALGVRTQRSASHATWKGRTVRVQLRSATDGLLATSLRVDDVSLR